VTKKLSDRGAGKLRLELVIAGNKVERPVSDLEQRQAGSVEF
jgi:hypothetical protein